MSTNKNYIGFIYIWVNTTNNKKYIGSHIGSIDDGYVGSGKYFKRAYNKSPENFKREILEYVYDKNIIFIIESKYLNSVDNIITNPEYYNLTNIAIGGSNHDHLSDEGKNKMYFTIKEKRDKWFKSLTNEEKKALFEKQKNSRNNKSEEQKIEIKNKRIISLKNKTDAEKIEIANKKRDTWKKSIKRKSHSENTKKRRLLEESLKTEEEKNKFKELCKESWKNRDPEKLIETKKIIQKNSLDFWRNPENKTINDNRIKKMLETKKEKKSRYITKNKVNKLVPEKDLSIWINQGWAVGMFRPRR